MHRIPALALLAVGAATLAGGAAAEEQTLRFKLVTTFTGDAPPLTLANLPDQSLDANEAVGVAVFEDGRIAYKQFVAANSGGAENGSFMGLSTYTFENGDSLTLRFQGGWSPEGAGGDYEVISGTGAFARATGTGRFDALSESWADADLWEGSFTLEVPGT